VWEETLLVVSIRLLVPLLILRWPLWGGIAAIVADNLDVVLASLIEWGGIWNYHRLDKLLDSYYLTVMAAVALRWDTPARETSLVLYVFRLIGVILFETTGIRKFLFFFPAVFETFFLFNAARLQFFSQYALTTPRLVFWLIVVSIPKLVQEYFIHYQQALDDVVAVEVIEDVKDAILNWLKARWPG
jgi:hypothetical protein